MKTDSQLDSDVMEELAWDPAINPDGIGVMVKDGVRSIAIELDVKLAAEHKRSDSEIAQAASTALRLNSLVPQDKVQVEVENGFVTLIGEVDWSYQYERAEQSIRPLAGVRGLHNRITVKPCASVGVLERQIAAALTRQAVRKTKHIKVEVDGGKVTLLGKVHSLAESKAAVGATFAARGISRVINKLQISG